MAAGSQGVPAPRQVIHWEEGADWRRAVDPPGVSAAGVPPQGTGIRPAPEGGAMQLTAVPLVGFRRAAGKGLRLIHSALGGANGLPAGGGSGQRLPLCKKAADFLLAGELSHNSSVPQNTPVETAVSRTL